MIPSHLPSLRLTSADGATADIALDGGHVTSWIPAGSTEDRLFISERSTYGPGMPIRGGIPVIFPQFGPFGTLRQHGFARNCRWTIDESSMSPGHVTLRLNDDESTRETWPHAFSAALAVMVAESVLSVSLTIHNRDATPFEFTAALHPYFAVRNAFEARVKGLAGLRYRDSLQDGAVLLEEDDVLRITGPIDRIYFDAPDRIVIVDTDRRLVIEKRGFPECVVWNPGVEGTASRTDFAAGDESRMLCVEGAAIRLPVHLAPGESWTGEQRMIAVPSLATE